MAATPQSFSTGNTGSSLTANITVNLPSGTVAGDLCIASYFHFNTSAETLGTGFTQKYRFSSVSFGSSVIASKIVTSGDITTGSYTFAVATNDLQHLTLIRVTGSKGVNAVNAFNSGTTASSTGVTSAGITPLDANSTIMFFVNTEGNANANSTSGYAIVTSNPTFTELYDQDYLQGANHISYAMAYGTRTAITATGNGTATNARAADNIGILIAVAPLVLATASDTVTVTDSMTISKMLNILISEVVLVTDSIVIFTQRVWTNIIKSVTTWVNKNKDL